MDRDGPGDGVGSTLRKALDAARRSGRRARPSAPRGVRPATRCARGGGRLSDSGHDDTLSELSKQNDSEGFCAND